MIFLICKVLGMVELIPVFIISLVILLLFSFTDCAKYYTGNANLYAITLPSYFTLLLLVQNQGLILSTQTSGAQQTYNTVTASKPVYAIICINLLASLVINF